MRDNIFANQLGNARYNGASPNRNITMKKKNNIYIKSLLLVVAVVMGVSSVFAEGSKDLYKDNASGGRAFLRASTTETPAFPFANLGTHFVYAEAGERIALATSAQAYGDNNNTRNANINNIRLYGPDGNLITLSTGNNTDTQGRIDNRTAELAGPQLPNQTGGGRYTPIYHEVTVTGIYKVEYLSTSRSETGDARFSYAQANANWTQSSNSNYLAAWDISVAKQTEGQWSWVPGRTYTTVLNMDNPSYGGQNGTDNANFRPNSGFYGKFKVLTRDGYVYDVDNNGNQGISFTFMVNNRGFHEVGDNNKPSYKSIAASTASAVQNRYHDPRSADAEAAVTHKIFYNLPDQSMPESAIGGPEPNELTWLRPEQQNLNVTDMEVEGVDATAAQISNKGGYIIFENNSGGDYIITISPSFEDPNYEETMYFETRILTGQSYPGENRIYFDGKDGYGEYLPQGNIPVEVSIQLQGAEVHFPYIDMELNKGGIIIELLDIDEEYDVNKPKSDKVYWNDSDIRTINTNTYGSMTNPRNASHTLFPNGTSSNENGHKWGTNSNATAGTFGDNQGMDTWTFIKGDSYTQSFAVVHKVADLSIESVTVASENEKIKIGDELTYTVVAANKKGSCPVEGAPFSFILPEGFVPVVDGEENITVLFSSDCGSESEVIEYDATTNSYKSKLNLGGSCDATGGDCSVTYTFKVKVTEDANPANTEVIATIMRPNDVTDPDATNQSDPRNPVSDGTDLDDPNFEEYYYPPTDPFFEVKHNGNNGESNNIKDLDITLIRESDLAIVKSADAKDVEIGETVTFTLTVTNYGPHAAVGVIVTDTVPAGYTNITDISDSGVYHEGIITWNLGELANEDVKAITFKATVNTDGPYLNIAAVDGDVEDPNLENNRDSHNPVKSNSTNAVDDFFEASNNTLLEGDDINVLLNDFDTEGNTQLVTKIGKTEDAADATTVTPDGVEFTTENGGKVTIKSDGSFTYVSPSDKQGFIDSFWYQVCDNGEPVACDWAQVEIAVGICTIGVDGNEFKWSNTNLNGAVNENNTLSKTITQPATDYGFVFDIYELDNSFNMEINGTLLAVDEIEFQSEGTSGINIKFQDGDEYETNTGGDIWQMKGNATNPLIRVVIGPTGKVSMYGSKVSGGELYPLVLFNDNKFNIIPLKVGENEVNDIKVTQSIVSKTLIDGYGYGANKVVCPNYWYGFDDSNEWAENSNWTDNYVPVNYEDIEFATAENNSGSIMGLSGPGAGKGEAKQDLHLDDQNRIIKDLINKSDKNLIVTLENQLVVDGKVYDDNTGGIVVKADSVKASGTLVFNKPNDNQNVEATVQFYNKAYECGDCGYFRKSWQYFGIPVASAEFPYMPSADVLETIHKWDEPTNGNKWITPTGNLQAFVGYEINNKSTTKPTHIYEFAGTLNVGDAKVDLTKTSAVNYSGMNLIANSFTAAIPIDADAIKYSDNSWDGQVYLFNAGTRDQWRKLNGGTVTHDTQSGQYKVVPLHVAGNAGLPSTIPSMHTFMVNAPSSGTMTLKYDQLVKNELVDGMAWRSAQAEKREIPHIVVDVIGSNSADRVWLFEQAGTTRGFDAGWDGVKMPEKDIVQIYVAGEDANENYQVATVPQLVGTSFGLNTVNTVETGHALSNQSQSQLQLHMAVSPDVEIRGLYLRDMLTGRSYALKNGAEYRVSGSISSDNRFKVVDNALDESKLSDNPLIDIFVQDNQVVVANNSEEDCTVSLFDISGRLVAKRDVASNGTTYVSTAISGVYVVKVIGGTVNESKRVVVK